MNDDMVLNISSMQKALVSFQSAIKIYNLRENDVEREEREVLRAGVIQSFECTYELCWKFMKRWIEMNLNFESVDGVTRRELFRQAAENKLIVDVDLWMEFHKARNATSHIYDEDVAEATLLVALKSSPHIKDFVMRLEARR
jgi:nucleotidyltransferase substrate binding protein (TIGR01987 family)